MTLPEPLAPMGAYNQWLNYVLIPQEDGTTLKIPVSPHTGRACDAHDPAAQTDYQTAEATGQPIAFVFTDADPFFFLDIDDCLNPDGSWSDTSLWLCQQFEGCAVEVSQSGEGMHIFGRIPVALDHGCDSKPLGSQFYTRARFVALTGDRIMGSADFSPDPGVYSQVIGTYFPPSAHLRSEDWTDAPCEEWNGPEDDHELIDRMLRARSAASVFGSRASLKALWTKDETQLAQAYPDERRAFDWSKADQALCHHLAFWTGKNCERIERIFGMSELVRDKWTDRDDYRQNTILKACAGCKNVYSQGGPKPGEPGAPTDEDAPDGLRVGYQYMTPQQQLDLFRGCVYVRDDHRVFTPDGALLRQDQFKSMYGGFVYAMDSFGGKESRNAWEVFTESQALNFPKAHRTCFRPEMIPGDIFEEDGELLVNTYIPIETPSIPGDPGPFLRLLERLVPDEGDRRILLSYMAACTQHIGVKFQWCPLVQGVQGNGKSFLGTALTHAVGHRYTHMPDSKDLGNVFNAWLQNKLLIVVEEVYTRDRVDAIQTLQWMVTNKRVPSQAKGGNQTTADNRANFIMFSNHKDAIRKTWSDRRFCVFYTAQQEASDLAQHGMDGNYFPELYAWADRGGWAVITDYLKTNKISDSLNPAVSAHRAPVTTSTPEAVQVSLGAVEQEITEAVEENRPGFCGGWVSSLAIERLIEGRRIPHNKRKEIMKELGYIPHPALPGGRVHNPIPWEEGRKPRLYIKKGHINCNLTRPVDATRKYIQDQGWEAQAGQSGAAGAAGGV